MLENKKPVLAFDGITNSVVIIIYALFRRAQPCLWWQECDGKEVGVCTCHLVAYYEVLLFGWTHPFLKTPYIFRILCVTSFWSLDVLFSSLLWEMVHKRKMTTTRMMAWLYLTLNDHERKWAWYETVYAPVLHGMFMACCVCANDDDGDENDDVK